jgi:methyl-accepting chemotaxis protein
VVEDIRQSSESLGVSSQQIASGSMDLSVRTEQTASNLAEAAASMGELTLTVRHSADASNLAKKMASSASDLAKKGESAMSDVAKRMRDIESSGQQIANIVGTIDAIAFQTNILALNAAVEAARAGDQGRGFAVVATEVRILAKRSADAAKEIKTLIDASVKNIQDGSGQVHRAGATMDEVATSVQHVSEMVSQITLSTEEQSRGISQVNIAVAQLDQMTQQNAALVEEYSAAAEGLREQATQLNQSMAMFQTHKR